MRGLTIQYTHSRTNPPFSQGVASNQVLTHGQFLLCFQAQVALISFYLDPDFLSSLAFSVFEVLFDFDKSVRKCLCIIIYF